MAIAFGAACDTQANSTVTSPHDAVSADATVNALEEAYGLHRGERRNHTKGTCALGSFVGDERVLKYSRSQLFSGQSIPVVARFSLAGGNPTARDTEKSPRGMALEFRLPNGALQHMTMINTPMFFAATPRTFLDKMKALKPDPRTGEPDPEALKAFAASHPDNTGQARYLAEHNPPPSYANSAYYGIHTFRFISGNDTVTLVRWRFVPRDGEKELSNAELAAMPATFLEGALIRRTEQGPVPWTMIVTIGQADDTEDDPTQAWPSGRQELTAGVLTISSAMREHRNGCENINYDPLMMADGIAPSTDPVLLFRSPSYGVSAARRLQER